MTQPSVLITGARAPVALHWCRLFDAAGWSVVLADSLKAPLARFSRKKKSFEPLPSPREEPVAFARRIAEIVDAHNVGLILPTCEEVFHLAHAAQTSPNGHQWRDMLYAPSLEALITLHDKARFNAHVTEIAPAFAPAYYRLESADQVERVPGQDWVFKPCFSRFGTDTMVRPTADQRARITPSPDRPWIAQAYAKGEELCCSALVEQGRVLALQAYRPIVRLRRGTGTGTGTGAGVAFEAADEAAHRAIEPFVAAVARAMPGRGQLSFDFRSDASGQFKVLECNPRSTSGLHFFPVAQGLVEAVSSGQETRFRAPPKQLMGERLATALVGGLPALVRLHRLHSLSAWPDDALSLWSQARAFGELVRTARRHKCSLEAATTWDIRWDRPHP